MLRLQSFAVSLPFQYPFTISKGTKCEQPALLTSLSFGKLSGWGEAPAIHYYGITVEGMMETLERARPLIERYSLTDPQRFWHFLHHLLPGQNFLIAALDIAAWDLFGQLRRQPMYQLLGLDYTGPVRTSYTIGLDTPERMVEKLSSHPCSIYKIKLAAPDDIDLLRSLRAVTDAVFRVDVNEGWTYDDTLRLLPELEALGVVLLEQPLPKGEWEAMCLLKAQSPIQLFADEACVEECDVGKCAEAFHGIVIKLTKCGGLTPALRMAQEARSRGLQVMLGSMNESTIGTSALIHLSPAADHFDTDGPLLLCGDHARNGLRWNEDSEPPFTVGITEAPGLGITV